MNMSEEIKDETSSICRLCLNYSTEYTLATNHPISIYSQINDCLPDINLELSDNPLICTSCCLAIQQFHTFKQQCTNNEAIITNYFEKNDVNASKVLLWKVLDYEKQLGSVKVELVELEKTCKVDNEYQVDNSGDYLENDHFNKKDDAKIKKTAEKKSTRKSIRKKEVTKKVKPKETRNDDDRLEESYHKEDKDTKDLPNSENDRKSLRKREVTKKVNYDEEYSNDGIIIPEHSEQKNDDDYLYSDPDLCDNESYNSDCNDLNDFKDDPIYKAAKKTRKKEKPQKRDKSEPPITYKCEHCPKVFVQKFYYEKHVNNHDALTHRNKYLCTYCGKSFKKHSHMKAHTMFHTNTKTHKCKLCEKTFYNSGGLTTHMRAHTGERRYKCTECSKMYSNTLTFRKHRLIHEEEAQLAESGVRPPRKFPCSLCEEQFHIKPDLEVHMQTAHTGKKFHCPTCGFLFVSAILLKRHEFIHTGLKPFLCTVCGKGFNRNCNMVKHMKVHENIR